MKTGPQGSRVQTLAGRNPKEGVAGRVAGVTQEAAPAPALAYWGSLLEGTQQEAAVFLLGAGWAPPRLPPRLQSVEAALEQGPGREAPQ